MSHSVVKVIETDLAESLTLIVGEDGIITPDKETALSVLGNRPTTDLNILYMNKTVGNKLDVTLDSLMYINSDDVEDADYNMDEVSRNLRNLKLDHDYTSFKSPTRAPAEEEVDLEDELAQTLRLLDGHMPDDEAEQKLTQISRQKEKDSAKKLESPVHKIVRGTNTIQNLVKMAQKAAEIAEKAPETKVNTEEGEEMEEDEDDETTMDEDESDDENDSDFTLDDEKPKMQPRRISSSKRSVSIEKIVSTPKPPKAKPIVKTPKIPGGKQPPKTPPTPEKPAIKEPEPSDEEPPLVVEQPNKPVLESISRIVEKKPPPPKKEKKPPKPIPDDFALFSTPDIIRRVGTGKEATPDPPKTPTHPNQPPSPKQPAKITPECRSRTTSVESKAMPSKLPAQKRHSSDAKLSKDGSLFGATSTPRRTSVDKQMAHVSVQEFETNSSNESGEKSGGALEPLPSAEDIRAIIQSDAIKTFTTYTDDGAVATESATPLTTTTASQQSPAIDPASVSSLDHIDQTLLLDNISPDLITDDILYQVAQSLVDNTVLQNAIDKMEVDPAVVGDFIANPTATDVEHNVNMSQSSPISGQQQQSAASTQQIVRPDGRVITLPPVERPTTRSRNRRGPNVSVTAAATPTPSTNTSSLTSPATSIASTPTSSARAVKTSAKALDSGNELDSSDDDDDDGDEEDPNKLWCICNQPHNNRFMICCDTCEEWYHGKCVNVTKAMGQTMETEGREWMCLYCKDLSLKRPKAAARRIRKASRTSSESAPKSSTSLSAPITSNRPPVNQQPPPKPVAKQQQQQQLQLTQTITAAGVAKAPGCLICGKPTTNNKLFCSDECILKHAANVEKKVVVYDRKTHKLLTGANAPTAANLDRWLKEHPTYEVVRTKKTVSPQQQLQQQLHMQQQQQQQQRTLALARGQMMQSKLKLVRNDGTTSGGVSLAVQKRGVNVGMLKHTPSMGQQQQQQHIPQLVRKFPPGIKIIQRPPPTNPLALAPKTVKLIPASNLPQFMSNQQQIRQNTIAKAKAAIQTKLNMAAGTPPSGERRKPPINVNAFIRDKAPGSGGGRDKRPIPTKTPIARQAESLATTSNTPTQKQENIREGIRKSLLEQLLNRLKLVDDLELTDDELVNISDEIESQLYKCFGDTGQKYRNKYRSLIFNIKDLKNQTLWRKICENAVNPYQLVRLSSDDLASQELAMWRERETKHQLDMIKKSELDLMSCNRQYVFKTHKGEQVFEDDKPKENLTDVISDLGADSTLDRDKDGDKSGKDRDKKSSSSKSSRRDRSKDRGRDRDRKYKDKTDSKERRRDNNERNRKKRSRSRDKNRSRSRDRDKERRSSHKSSRHKKDLDGNKLDKKSTELLEQLVDKHILKPFEDKLWKHVPQDDLLPNASLESDSDHEPTSTVTIPTPPRSADPEEPPATDKSAGTISAPTATPTNDTDDKFDIPATPSPAISPKTPAKVPLAALIAPPSSASSSPGTVAAGTEPLWRGTINMVDVAEISITAHEVSGDCKGLTAELPPALDIVGRIMPDTVWDYIGNIKSSHSKVISLLRLNASNVVEKMSYISLYSYLSTRNRLGVVKVMNKVVKDFYILPLASHIPIPQALLPLNGPGFEESRPHLLLGIVIRNKRKRPAIEPIPGSISATPAIKRVKVDVIITGSPKDKSMGDKGSRSYTPPPSGSRERDPRRTRTVASTAPSVRGAGKMDRSGRGGKQADVVMVVEEEEEDDADGMDVDGELDDDEPYSPEDSDPDSLIVPIDSSRLNTNEITNLLTGSVKASSFIESGLSSSQAFEPFTSKFDSIPGLDGGTSIPASALELQRKMAELDQKIAMQKAEIDNMSHDIATTAATTDIGTSVLANIALPSDLQQILENIKTIGGAQKEMAPKTPDRKISPLHNPKWSPPDSLSTTPVPTNELTMPLILPRLSIRNLTSPQTITGASSIPLNLPKLKIKPLMPALQPAPSYETTNSVLSSLTEADLIRKAAEMLGEAQKVAITAPPPPKLSKLPPPPVKLTVAAPPLPVPAPIGYIATPIPVLTGYQTVSLGPPPPPKKKKVAEMVQPPIPGLEDEML